MYGTIEQLSYLIRMYIKRLLLGSYLLMTLGAEHQRQPEPQELPASDCFILSLESYAAWLGIQRLSYYKCSNLWGGHCFSP